MTKTSSASIGLLLASAVAACSSSTNEPADANAHGDAATDARAGSGGRGDTDGARDALDAATAPFVPPTGTQRLVAGQVTLVGSGSDSCTNQPGATTDRWCAFLLPAPTQGFELWVLDATAAAAGIKVACDGTDAHCVRLATDAFHENGAGSLDGGFAGDTLLYRRGPDATLIDGPVWAWRPGWATGRELVTGLGTACFGAPGRATAFCVRTTQGLTDGSEANDLFAGTLDAAGDGPLPLVETIITSASSDPAGSSSDLELGFSPDGAYVAWSTNGLASSKGLEVQKIGDPIAPLAVATDVSDWQMSGDGTAWLWLRSYTDDIVTPTGTLETAAFPAGTGVATVAPDVADYEPVGDKGLLYRANAADQVAQLRYAPDLTQPATSILIDEGVRSVVSRSADASTIIYSKVSTAVGVDLYAWSSSLTAPCTLTSTPAAFSIANLMDADHVVVWAQRDIMSQVISGATTTLASCETKTFGSNLIQQVPAGDDRLLFIDGEPSGSISGTLRVAPIAADGAPSEGTPLQTGVDLVYAVVAPGAVLYTIAGGAGGGLYLYAGPLLGASTTSNASTTH